MSDVWDGVIIGGAGAGGGAGGAGGSRKDSQPKTPNPGMSPKPGSTR